MTSRLKRKLNDLGVDPSSSRANESFCLIGTPLPPLEKSKDTGEFVPLWKQEVRDEKGRRRLHGAFTGGFSAGYFNTVGSKEGWAPSTFVSSRSDRAKKKAARPEDFMDDEDLAELRDSQQLVDENEEMDFGGTESELRRRAGPSLEEDSMASALAASLAPPTSDSVGARILKKMGWRMGQGIGPRITYEQRRAQDRAVGAAAGEEDDEAKKHMYPRRDTPLLLVSRKDNSHGLGYTPGMSLDESLGRAAEAKGPRISAGFGLGALNDADEDDLDVYETALGSGKSKRIMAYDAADDDDQITMGSSRGRAADNRIPPRPETTQTFRDGRTVLKGFVLSDQPVAEDRWFPLPEVPSGWKPNPRRVWEASADKENESVPKDKQHKETPQNHHEWKQNLLSADERGSILGETPLPSQPRSVFDYMSQKDKERLANIRTDIVAGASGSSKPTESGPSVAPLPSGRTEVDIPHVHPSVAKAALQGFQPFTADPVKQSRYTAFLNHASSASGTELEIAPLPGQRTEDFNKELADYAKAATVFKPLSGAMASRFKSAAIVETGPKVIEGLHTPDLSAPDPAEEPAREEKKDEDPRMAAVRLGMYGPLTRETTPWQPARLLCKRFGVKDPEVEPRPADAEPTAGPGDAPAGAPGAESGAMAPPPLAIEAAPSEAGVRAPRNLANVGLGEDDAQGRDTLTYQRPAMDVFKAIFASDDEDEDEDLAEEENAGPSDVTAPAAKESKDAAPRHLLAAESSQASYEPKASVPTDTPSTDQKVDLATFKPTFVPRTDRESRKDKDKDRSRDKKSKKAKALVSFDDGEEGLHISVNTKKRRDKDKDADGERKKKKRKERGKKDEDDDDSMWVEKPAPDVVQNLFVDDSRPPASESPSDAPDGAAGPPRGRKRAVDFM